MNKIILLSINTQSYLLKHSTCARVLPSFLGVEKHSLEIISFLTHYFSSQVHFFNHLKRLLDSNIIQTKSSTLIYQSDSDTNTVKQNNVKPV